MRGPSSRIFLTLFLPLLLIQFSYWGKIAAGYAPFNRFYLNLISRNSSHRLNNLCGIKLNIS